MNRLSKEKLTAWVYMFTMSIAFLDRFGNLRIDDNKMQMVICIFWIVFGFAQMAIDNSNHKEKKDILFFMNLYFVPHLIIHLYSTLLLVFGKSTWGYFSSNISVYVPTLAAIMSVYLFKEKSINYILYSMILSWTIALIAGIVQMGPGIFVFSFMNSLFGYEGTIAGVNTNYFEMHDLVLAIGYFVVFFIFIQSKITRRNLWYLFAVVFVMAIGLKRISILAIIVAIVFNILIKYLKEGKQYRLCCIAGVAFGIFCFLYVYVCAEHSEIIDMLESYGVNMAGRSYYYTAVMDYVDFSPFFMGLGRNAVVKILTEELYYFNIGGVHSDVIKMYVEIGFVMFVLWLWYYLVHVTVAYKKRFKSRSAVLYFGMTIYTFSLYLTDNIETYCISQMVSIILPMAFAIYFEELKEIKLFKIRYKKRLMKYE